MATYLNGKRLDNLWFKNEYELTLVYFGIKKIAWHKGRIYKRMPVSASRELGFSKEKYLVDI